MLRLVLFTESVATDPLSDVLTNETPLEAGLGFAVSLKKGDFLGKDALLAQKEAGLKRRLECFALETPLSVYGGEAMIANGKHSDATMERRWHVATPAIVAAIGLALAANSAGMLAMVVVAFSLALGACLSGVSAFWSLPSLFGAVAAFAIVAGLILLALARPMQKLMNDSE